LRGSNVISTKPKEYDKGRFHNPLEMTRADLITRHVRRVLDGGRDPGAVAAGAASLSPSRGRRRPTSRHFFHYDPKMMFAILRGRDRFS